MYSRDRLSEHLIQYVDICIPAGFGPRASCACPLAGSVHFSWLVPTLPSHHEANRLSKLQGALKAGRLTPQLRQYTGGRAEGTARCDRQSLTNCLQTNKARSTWRSDVIPPTIRQGRRKARKQTGHKGFIIISITGANTHITITIGRNERVTCPRASSTR
jgi:hypothetical protein